MGIMRDGSQEAVGGGLMMLVELNCRAITNHLGAQGKQHETYSEIKSERPGAKPQSPHHSYSSAELLIQIELRSYFFGGRLLVDSKTLSKSC